MQNRPLPEIFSKTNTSASIRFMSRPLEERCNAIVISHPPIIFGIDVERGELSLPGLPIVSNSHFCVHFFGVYCVICTTVVHI